MSNNGFYFNGRFQPVEAEPTAPDREDVLRAMNDRFNWRENNFTLRANARDVARQLRDEADRLRHQGYSIQGAELLRLASQLDPKPSDAPRKTEYCHASKDGECLHRKCPQRRDGEPNKTSRNCPLPDYPEHD